MEVASRPGKHKGLSGLQVPRPSIGTVGIPWITQAGVSVLYISHTLASVPHTGPRLLGWVLP